MSIRVLVRFKSSSHNLQLYYVDPDSGKEVAKSSGTRDIRQADKAAARWEDELKDFRGKDDDSWDYFRERFSEEHLAALSKKTHAIYETSLNAFEHEITVARVSEISASTISTFQAKMLEAGRPLTTAATYLTHLRAALNWAESVSMIHKAPTVKIPKQAKRVFMRGRPLTEVGYKSMLKACDTIYGQRAASWRRLLELLWLSGLRLGEAAALSWDQPPIVADLEAEPYPQLLFYAEGHKARRDEATPMTPDLAAWLQKTPPKQRRGLVAPVHVNNVPRLSQHIQAIGEAAGVRSTDDKFASAHDFRRAFGTRWAAVVMPATLQKIMRHADISTTLKYYVGMSSADAGRELWEARGGPKTGPKAVRGKRNAG